MNTGEPVIGAAVYLPKLKSGTYTDAFGNYAIKISSGDQTIIVVSYPGFQSDTITTNTLKNDIVLSPAFASTIVVQASRLNAGATGVTDYNVEELKRLPIILGEPDLLKAVITSAGIQGGAEGTSGINVRGGGDDQNLYLLDGSTIYNPNHVFGFLSMFHPSVVQRFQLYKGYIPPKFSGRLSSVLDVATKAGNTEEIRKELTTGLITNSFVIDGPLDGKNDGVQRTFLASGRIANIAPLTLISQATGLLSENGTRLLAGMYDINLKLTNRYSNDRTLDISAYLGDDLWGGRAPTLNSRTISGSEIVWGNKLISLRYNKPNVNGVTIETGANLNRYANSYRTFERGEGIDNQVLTKSSINELKVSRTYKIASNTTSWSGGIELKGSLANPANLKISNREITTTQDSEQDKILEGRLYGSVKAYPHETLALEAGMSVSTLSNISDQYQAIYLEPRVGISYSPTSRFRWGASYGITAQPVHRLSSFAFGLPYDIWTPASNRFPVAKANQFSTEIDYRFDRLSLTLAGYYKNMSNLLYPPNDGILPTIEGGDNQDSPLDNVAVSGEGRAYGGEVSASYAIRKANINLAYTYSRSLRTFGSVNRGVEFPFAFDRPHDLTVTGNVPISSRWTFNGLFALQSGRAVTIPTGITENIFGVPSPFYPGVNNFRLKPYHRLDISFRKEFITKKKKRKAALTLGIYNVYARKNPVRAFVEDIAELGRSSIDGPIGYKIMTNSVLLSIPSISYTRSW